MTGRVAALCVSLLRKLQRIFDLDAQIAHRALEFAVTQKKLHSAQVVRTPVDQGGLRPAHRVRAIRRAVEANFLDPAVYDASVLPGSKMWRLVNATWEEEVASLQICIGNSCFNSLASWARHLELDWLPRFLLDHLGAGGQVSASGAAKAKSGSQPILGRANPS